MSDRDAEIIRRHEQELAEGRPLDGFMPIKGTVSKNLTFSTSVRFTPEEFSRLSEAARSRGMTLSAFLRAAAEAALNGRSDVERIAAIQEARQKVNELQATLARACD
jgi:hypothetical protein